jgi:hypothetical protein
MKAISTLAAAATPTLVLALFAAPAARGGDDPAPRLGDHPAIVVQRLAKSAGYDYASKFYPHPAWLHLHAEQPRDAADGTAVATTGEAQRSSTRRAATSDGALSTKVSARSGG